MKYIVFLSSCLFLVLLFSCHATKTNEKQQVLWQKQKADSLHKKAQELMLQNKHPEALRLLNKAIQGNPANPWYYADKGATEINLLLYQEGIEDIKKAIALQLVNEKLYVNMAVGYNNLAIETNKPNLLDTAIYYSNAAIKLNNNFGFAYYIRGESFLFKGDTISLCNNLSKALKTGFNEAMPRILKYCSKK